MGLALMTPTLSKEEACRSMTGAVFVSVSWSIFLLCVPPTQRQFSVASAEEARSVARGHGAAAPGRSPLVAYMAVSGFAKSTAGGQRLPSAEVLVPRPVSDVGRLTTAVARHVGIRRPGVVRNDADASASEAGAVGLVPPASRPRGPGGV